MAQEAVVDPAAGQAPAPANKKKKLLFIGIGVAVLLGGAAGGFLLMRGKHDAAKPESAAADKHAAAPKGPAVYIALDPPFVVNFENQQAVRFLQVTVQLMTRDPATAALLKENDPVIRNDLLLLFGGQQYTEISTREGKEKLRSQALEAARKVVTAEGGKAALVENLYFTSFVMQ